MTPFNQVRKELKARGITPLKNIEEQIIIFHLSVGENIYSIISLISRIRSRSILIDRLTKIGIKDSDLSPAELEWIEEILSNGRISIDDAIEEIKDARSNNRQLKNSKTI
ncbi:hypothetical protein [Janthinobacterium sp. PSPC2-1]|uniref:hypothetical protein n=1 Tax=unclassified Janthinobacterium TaxID=2610881 RepID=UPI003CF34E1D